MTHDPAQSLLIAPPPPPRNLLVVRLTALGDIVQSLQIIQSVARQWPGCRITWVVRDTFAPLVEAAPFVHHVIAYRRKAGWRGLLETICLIRRERFDMVWDMHGLIRPALMTLAARSPQKWGRKNSKGLCGLSYNQFVPTPADPPPHHAMTVHQQFLRTAGLDSTIDIPLSLKPISQTGQLADDWKPFFNNDSKRDSGPLFVMFTDSSAANKMWNGYEALTRLIWVNYPDSRVVWCGLKPLPPPPMRRRAASLTCKANAPFTK
ncbi:glycosyltransferase family 9 protein [Geminisphaera colitermitum]|uniref:glycosyltransferase family 9 protein n=1 Tax=Geminisphaera colitermitum TaxID=1148786 RepID=UPI0005BD422A|nr:glycosyltransferase family 9 protein [Geminisphaera colitermitum]